MAPRSFTCTVAGDRIGADAPVRAGPDQIRRTRLELTGSGGEALPTNGTNPFPGEGKAAKTCVAAASAGCIAGPSPRLVTMDAIAPPLAAP